MSKKKKVYHKLNIPPDVNTYDAIVEQAKTNPQFRLVLQALNDTLDHFKVPPPDRRTVGDLIERFSMWMARIDVPVTIGEDPELNYLVDMVDFFHKRSEALLS